MITQLYTFSPSSFVLADEWNANFSVLNKSTIEHLQWIQDAYNDIAFPNSDLTNIFNAVYNYINSRSFTGTSLHITSPNVEYWNGTAITTGQQLAINVEKINGEARILFKTTGTRTQDAIAITYAGGSGNINYISNSDVWKPAGVKAVFLYETNNKLNVRLVG